MIPFVLKLQSFTGIDNKVSFDVNIHANIFEPDQDALNEIEIFMNGTTNRLGDLDIIEKGSDDISINGGDGITKDVFTFQNNSSSHNYQMRKSTKNAKNVVRMSESSDDDNTTDEDYSSLSSYDP